MVGVKGQIQSRGVERRRAIIDAAIEQFAREGYHGTGIASIAKQAGITTGGVLHHFGSKEQLLVEVLKRRDEEALRTFQDWPTGSLQDVFNTWVEVATWNEKRAPLAALYSILHAESIDDAHPAHTYFHQRTKVVIGQFERALRAAIDRGEIRADVDVRSKASEIVAFVEGAILLWLPSRKRGALRARFKAYFDDQLALMAPGQSA